jgi:hypothetical protein
VLVQSIWVFSRFMHTVTKRFVGVFVRCRAPLQLVLLLVAAIPHALLTCSLLYSLL